MFVCLTVPELRFYGCCHSCYLTYRMIDSFPQISKWIIIKLKPILLAPSGRRHFIRLSLASDLGDRSTDRALLFGLKLFSWWMMSINRIPRTTKYNVISEASLQSSSKNVSIQFWHSTSSYLFKSFAFMDVVILV